MPLSQQFVWNRMQCTIAAQNNAAATWVWAGKSLAGWAADSEEFNLRNEISSQALAKLRGVRGELDGAMETLHEKTVVYLTVLKSLHRKNPVRQELLAPLTAAGGSRNAILDEATELQSAWETIDPAWEPTEGETLEDFTAETQACAAIKKLFSEANTAWRNRASELRVFVEGVNEDCVGWYAAATAIFGAGTALGSMIRGTVPTTFSPSAQKEPELDLKAA